MDPVTDFSLNKNTARDCEEYAQEAKQNEFFGRRLRCCIGSSSFLGRSTYIDGEETCEGYGSFEKGPSQRASPDLQEHRTSHGRRLWIAKCCSECSDARPVLSRIKKSGPSCLIFQVHKMSSHQYKVSHILRSCLVSSSPAPSFPKILPEVCRCFGYGMFLLGGPVESYLQGPRSPFGSL